MNFKQFIEAKSISDAIAAAHKPENIKWWANYLANKIFPTEQAARDEVFRIKQRADKEPSPFAPDGEEYNRAFANAIPIWQSGKSFKVGKRIRIDNRLRRSELTVRKPDLYEMNVVAQANGTGDFKFHWKVRWIPIKDHMSDDDVYAKDPNEIKKIQNLANAIKENKWIEAVIYHVNEGWIIEGQHRTRAMKLLGFNTVPAVGIEYYE